MVGYTLGRRLLVGDRGGGIIMTATTRGHNILMYTTRDEFQILGRPMRDGGCGHGFQLNGFGAAVPFPLLLPTLTMALCRSLCWAALSLYPGGFISEIYKQSNRT